MQLTREKSVGLLIGDHILANIAMLITVFFWGISFISIKIAVSEVPPITMALIRFVMASLLLLIVLQRLEPDTRLRQQDKKRMVFAGLLGITIYFCFENSGVKLTTASSASLITSVVPILSITLDVIVFKTKVSLLQSIGMGIAVLGTYLTITVNGTMDLSSDSFQGNVLIMGAMLAWTGYTLINKSLQQKYTGLFITTYQMVFGTLFLIPAALTEYQAWQLFSVTALLNIIFLAVCCSAICYFLYIYALKYLDVAVTTLYLNLVPIVGVISGYFILQETIAAMQLVGGAIIIIAIIIVNWDKFMKVSTR
ncbi:MAG: DMT family transporter [Pelosinus sp.]|nr:DMT family transporter [Pelosinus sp.]